MKRIEGNIIDLRKRKIYPGELWMEKGRIVKMLPNQKNYAHYLCPGFVDAHVHIESSMLLPDCFSDMVVQRGVIAIVNDPHEIANVLGAEGVELMMENAAQAVIKIFFGIPSCVPATAWDAAGGKIGIAHIRAWLKENKKFVALSEMMNVPGVLQQDTEVREKLEIAREYGLILDGHAPSLRGEKLKHYVASGITTDHECGNLQEAEEKIREGMKVIMREGSAARNYDSLKELISLYPDQLMFCTDDAHPDDILEKGSIDRMVRKAVQEGFDLFDVLKIACLNPVKHYKLDVGTLQEGEKADFMRIENLHDFLPSCVYIDGKKVYDVAEKKVRKRKRVIKKNHFCHDFIPIKDLAKKVGSHVLSIEIKDGCLLTGKKEFQIAKKENLQSDLECDLLKLVYVNRYRNGKPQIAYVTGTGLKKGAFASSVSHDSHNLLAIGTNDEDIATALNKLIEIKGGLVVSMENCCMILPLPVAGIMSNQDAWNVALNYKRLNACLQKNGCRLNSPFMTLSFLSLLVIPELKIGEKGLFDGEKFAFIEEEKL